MCVQPDTRPNIRFEDGICPACRFAEANRNEVDFDARWQELQQIAEMARASNVSGYDCIIGVSGGKDSTRQALIARDQLGLKPLLVSCTYPPEQQTERGARNLANLITLGFDCISVSPDPKLWKLLMRESFLRYGNWCKSTEMALYASAPIVSIAYHIPVIFLGENPAITLGELGVGTTGVANASKHSNTLTEGPLTWGVENLTPQQLFWYDYPSDEDMEAAAMKIYYLGYYVRDFSRFENARVSVENGLEIRHEPPEEIGDYYGFEALDDDFVVMNQMLKHMKFGFGKVTEQVAEATRLGMMTRAKAVELVRKFDGRCAERYIQKFCDYLEITLEQFWQTAERFRNLDIWKKNEQGQWELKVPLV